MEMKGRGIKRNIAGTQSDRESMLRKKKEVSHSKGEPRLTDRMHGHSSSQSVLEGRLSKIRPSGGRAA